MPTTDPMCVRMLDEDFFYLTFDRRMDRYRDENAFHRFLTAPLNAMTAMGRMTCPG